MTSAAPDLRTGGGVCTRRGVLRPVRGHHAFEACVEQLATLIRLGVYPRGSTLPPERELADRLAVSRATLREAMAAMRQAGLVQTTRGRGGGTLVTMRAATPRPGRRSRRTTANRATGVDALDFRRIVEPGAAALAAECRTSTRGRRSASSPPSSRWLARAGRRCTGRPTRASTSPLPRSRDHSRIIESVTAVQSTLHEMLSAIPVLDANIAHSDTQHSRIVKRDHRRPQPIVRTR